MQKLTKNTDADTFRIDDEPTRVLGINTDESVAVNEGRNTQSGAEASARAKNILPQGTDVRTDNTGTKGTFGRNLADIKIQTKNGEVDYGLVALDQGMSKYSTDYGTHPDPEQHDKFKEYYSENAPYQYNETKPPLSQEDYQRVAKNLDEYATAEKAYGDGDISREDYEAVMHRAYGNGNEVAAFRYMNNQWQRDFDMKQFDGTDRMAYDWAHQSDENRAKYNKAVRNSHTGFRTNPEKAVGFWSSLLSDTATSFSALNDFSVMGRQQDLVNARYYGDDNFDVPDEELTRGLPVEWHDKVMQEAEKYGDDAALQYRDNLTTSLQNTEAMQEMPLATQIATAIPALLLSPATIIPGAKVAQGTVAAGRSIDMVMKAGRLKNLAVPSKVALWASAGALEAGISATPRLASDDTFTSKDMLNEMKYGAAFGVAIPAVVKGVSSGVKRVNDYSSSMNTVMKNVQKETEVFVSKPLVKPDPYVRKILDQELVLPTEVSKHLAAKEAATQASVPRTSTGAKVDSVAGEKPKPLKVLTDDDLNYLDNAKEGRPQNPKPPEEVVAIKKADLDSRQFLTEQATKRVDDVLAKSTPIPYKRGKVSATVDTATGTLTKSMTQTMLESPSKVSQFIGSELLELPEGLGGKIVRQPTAALQQHSLRTRYLTQTQPTYHKLIGEYAAESGKRGVGKFMAQHMDGQSNLTVKQFSRDVATVLEQRRQGRTVTVKSPSVLRMVDEFEGSMTKMYDDLVDAGVTGFRKERRIKHYFPQLWDIGGIRGARSKYGRGKVQHLLAKGYMNSQHNEIKSMAEALHVADNFLKNIDKGLETLPDGALPTTMDARAKTRLDIDTTTTDGDLSIMDLMETDTSTVSAKYANRAAGQVALANKGIMSELDVDALRTRMSEDGGDMQLFDDAINLVMGRPTRDGLDPGLNEMKDAVSLSKMGGLGMAQAAEAGSVLARTVMQLFNDPQVFKKVFRLARESTEDKQLMRETQALSGISNDVHLLDRQATHLDRNELDSINRVRNTARWVAGKASFGSLKAPAGYILSQASGFNMIRRFERRIANASFLLDISKSFSGGKGSISDARLRDLGLDINDSEIQRHFKDIATYDKDGVLKTLNLDKWDKKTREKVHLAMYRDDAQMVQQTIGGEMPAWINKPAMTIVAQFKQSAILANKKQLTRQMQFADKEAAMGTVLNAAMAGLTRTAKFGTLAAGAYAVTGNEKDLQNTLELDYLDPEKYVATFGFFPDMGHIAYDSYKAFDEDRMSVDTLGEGVASEIPMLGWMKDYYDLGTADSLQEKADAAKGVAILGNMQFADIIYKGVEAGFDGLPDLPDMPTIPDLKDVLPVPEPSRDRTEEPTQVEAPKLDIDKVSVPSPDTVLIEPPRYKQEEPTAINQPTIDMPKVELDKPTIDHKVIKPKHKTEKPQIKVNPNKVYHGKVAVAIVTQQEGKLTEEMKYVVEEEGYKATDYKDTKGITTSGAGQTGEFANMTFKEAFAVHRKRTVKMFPKLDTFSENLRKNLISSTYRGGISGSPKARRLINAEKYDQAATEFLDNAEYRKAKKSGSGVAKRMERLATALRNE